MSIGFYIPAPSALVPKSYILHLISYISTMSTQTLENRNIRKLMKMAGKSLVVSLPIEFVKELNWKEKQKVVVTKKGTKLIISDWKKKHIKKK